MSNPSVNTATVKTTIKEKIKEKKIEAHSKLLKNEKFHELRDENYEPAEPKRQKAKSPGKSRSPKKKQKLKLDQELYTEMN
jgi:hypothetical protein